MTADDADREETGEGATELARALAMLPDGETRYRTIVETAGEGIALALPDGRFFFVNRRFAEMLGYEPDEIVGKRGNDLTFDDWRPQVDVLRARLLGDEVLSGEFKFRRRDGAAVWTRWNATAIHGDDGVHVANIAMHTDITERKRTEEALARAEAQMRALAEATPDAVFIVDRSYRMTNCNEVYRELARRALRRAPLPGDDVLAVDVPTDVIAHWKSCYDRALTGGTFVEEFIYESPAFSRRASENHFAPVRDERGEVVGVAVSSRDVSDRHEAAARLASSEEQFRRLFETMAQGVVIQDAEGAIVAANPAAERILGLTLDQMRGLTSFDARWQAVREDGSPFPGEEHPITVARLTGRPVYGVLVGTFNPTEAATRWSSVDAVPLLRPGEERPYRTFAVFTDVTEQRSAEAALRASEDLFHDLFDRSAVGHATATLEGRFGRVNDAFCRMLGYAREELEGADLALVTFPEDDAAMRERMADVHDGALTEARVRRRFRAKDGSVRWGDGASSLRSDEDGHPLYYMTSIVDVTEQVAALEKIAQLQQMRDVAEGVALVGSARVDLATGERLWSPQLHRLLDVPPGSAPLGLEEVLQSRAHPDDLERFLRARRQGLEGEPASLDVRVLRQDGSEHILHYEGAPELDERGDVVATIGYLQDVTQQRESERRLREAEAARAAALERERIARDLHDAVTQNLYSANLILDVLPGALERDADRAAQDVVALRRLVRASLGELRTLLYELRPETLTSAPLGVLLERLGDALTGTGSVDVVTAATGDLGLPDDVHVTFYRVAQEALANVGKHAGASNASAVVDVHDEVVRLVVRDDGVGFDPALVVGGMGLGIMRERAESVGAGLSVRSTPGAGTTVTLLWPGAGSAEC